MRWRELVIKEILLLFVDILNNMDVDVDDDGVLFSLFPLNEIG